MLTPRKNPLADQPLIAAPAQSYRRVRQAFWVLLVLVGLTLFTWSSLLGEVGRLLGSEQGWRLVVSQVANWHFNKNVEAGRDIDLGARVKAMEAERLEMQATIQQLEKLVQGMRVDGWLRGVSSRRISEDTVEYEILVGTPSTGKKPLTGNLTVGIRGIDRFEPTRPETAFPDAAQRFKSNDHRLRVPKVAEAIKGQLTSRAANFLIISIVPNDNPELAEVAILPIGSNSTSRGS